MTILYRTTQEIDLNQLRALFESAGWERLTGEIERLVQLVRGSTYVISAWDDARLVGFARAISDGAFNAYISTVAVLPEYQKSGIERELMSRLLEGRDHLQFVLHANDDAYPFCLHLDLGFEPFENVLVRRRKY